MNFSHRFTVIHSIFLLAALTTLLVSSAEAANNGSAPINIEADRMVSQENDNSVIFTGNVDARQGDILIRTDKMTVFYSPQEEHSDNSQGSSQVEKLICNGNVQISQGDWLGTSSRMDYYAGDRKIILSGNAKAWQGPNMVSGKTITYYMDEGRSIVEGPTTASGPGNKKGKSGRVKAVIQPDAKSKP